MHLASELLIPRILHDDTSFLLLEVIGPSEELGLKLEYLRLLPPEQFFVLLLSVLFVLLLCSQLVFRCLQLLSEPFGFQLLILYLCLELLLLIPEFDHSIPPYYRLSRQCFYLLSLRSHGLRVLCCCFLRLPLGRHQLDSRYRLLLFGYLILTLKKLDLCLEVIDLVVRASRLLKHVIVLIAQIFDLCL